MLFPLSYRRKCPLSLLTEPVYHREIIFNNKQQVRQHDRFWPGNHGVGVPEDCGAASGAIDT